jgi:CrcB protein
MLMSLRALAGVAVAGAVGATARYALHLWTSRVWGERFPWGTLFINLVGCLLLGFMVEFVWRTSATNAWLRTFIPVGLLGGFTTFSTFSYETLRHAQDGHWTTFLLNILANVGLGLLATALGLWLARQLATA